MQAILIGIDWFILTELKLKLEVDWDVNHSFRITLHPIQRGPVNFDILLMVPNKEGVKPHAQDCPDFPFALPTCSNDNHPSKSC